MKYSDGSVYEGDWKDDKRHGTGKYTSSLGTYEGEWSHDQRNGKGIMRYANGDVYEGSWSADRVRLYLPTRSSKQYH